MMCGFLAFIAGLIVASFTEIRDIGREGQFSSLW